MTILKVVYASAPTDEQIILSLEVKIVGEEPIRVVHGYQDMLLGVDGEMVLFEQGSLSMSFPNKNSTSGNQNLSFGVSNANGRVQRYVDKALANDTPSVVTLRKYLKSDITAPADRPIVMDVRGGVFEGGNVQIEASYYDLLNTRWPREFYNQINAPGLLYI